eukprot:TRINITY_DN16744_c0_g1_i1.p2 TRINITY_DN16744_c0_g1~~TRINITY_DN16744_c0_g1_i1.p2  ORF type:complete len:467 (+),score=221.19 TRINITY_DN16744_c0_g1_i1:87-1403(+)
MYAGLPIYDATQDALREEIRHRRIAEYLSAQYAATSIPPAGYDYTPYARYAPPPVDLQPTQQEKLRATFSVLDANRSGAIEADEWVAGVKACNLGLTDETLADLHQKMGDGSYVSWLQFCGTRPALTDALFYRQQQKARAQSQKEACESVRKPLGEAQARAEEAVKAAQKEFDDEEAALQKLGEDAPDTEAQLKEAETAFQDSVKATDERVKERNAARDELARQWPEQQRRAMDQRAAELECAALARRMQDIEDRERALMEALEALRRDKEQVGEAKKQADSRRDQLAEDAKGGEDPERKLREAEELVHEAQRAEQQACEALRRIKAEADASGCRREQAEYRRRAAEQRLEQARAAMKTAEDAVADNEKSLQDAEAAAQHGPAMDASGELTEEGKKENNLVEQEVRLRQQRAELEERESVLRQEQSNFSSRALPQTTA